MAVVELKNVSKIYDGKLKVVQDVNLKIDDSEFVVLVGPSGCGKSTTLRMIAGLEDISEGEILIDGKLMNDVSPKDRDIAMVFQNYALYPHMSVYENMAFGLKLRKIDPGEIKSRVEEAAKILDLENYLNRKPKALSGGQRQRVAVGRAIVRKPKVFLFDEPLSNLDAKLRVQMRTELSRLHKKLNATMIYVTHDQTEAMTMGDRIVVMKDGKVQQYDRPLELYNNPINKFVAEFIGSPAMNFISGTIICDDGAKFQSDFNNLHIPLAKFNFEKQIGKKAIIGIRPEYFTDTYNAPNKLKVKLDVVEQMGNEVFAHFTLDGKSCISRLKPKSEYSQGSEISLAVDPLNVMFFDEQTGERMI